MDSRNDLLKRIQELETENNSLKLTMKTAGLAYWDWNPKTNEVTYDTEWFQQIDVIDKDGSSKKLDAWMGTLHPDDSAIVAQKIQDHLSGKIPIYEVTMRLKDKNGRYRHVLAKGKIIQRDESGAPIKFCGVHVDITEMSQLKEENELQKASLEHNSKLAALGEMAGGIAHEINTPLTIIKGLAEMCCLIDFNNPKNNEGFHFKLGQIQDTTDRIYKIVKGLQLFARDGSKDKKEDIVLASFLRDTISFIGPKLDLHKIHLTIDCPESVVVSIRQVQIAQVVVNLLNNAKDAIKDKHQKWIKVSVVEKDEFITISVKDSGNGIPKKVINKIFNPFFTTKAIGQGTGLGLSISKGIIEDHAGKLYVDDSSPNTNFIIQLPRKVNI